MNDIIPDNKRAEFLTFLSKCPKEIAEKKSAWLLGLELSGVQPPKKLPDLPFLFDMNKKPPNPSTEAANANGSQVELRPRMENIPTTPAIPNLWIINVPQQEPQAPNARHDDKLASSAQQLAQLLIPQWEPQAQKEKARRDDNLASSAHQLAQLLIPQQESQAQKEKACRNATLASSAQQLAQLLGEC